MLFSKNRVEEDLGKIGNRNLPNKKTYSEEDELKLEKGDLLAMILAVMSLILPYIIAFVGIMLGVIFLFRYLY